MALVNQVKGVPQILRNLDSASAKKIQGIRRGLTMAGLMIQRESQLEVPVDTGNLKASAFTRYSNDGKIQRVQVGYTAAYALYVHEAVDMKLAGKSRGAKKRGKGYRGHYWDPQGRAKAKFLEGPFRRLAEQIRAVILREAKR